MTLDIDLRVKVEDFLLEVALTARPGEVLAVLGANGSGKSTLLNAIAGLLPAANGRIDLGERDLRRLPPERRRIGLLGQRSMLFPHLSAIHNVAFGPRSQGVQRREAVAIAERWLTEVGLADLSARRPAELSGGQQQRVALARALAARPEALLLDEPFASLDAQTATQARRLVAAQRDRIGVPILLVTHDAVDAIMLASRTVVLHEGHVVQSGTTADVLGHPSSPFVAALAGVNFVEGTVDADGTLRAEGIAIAVPRDSMSGRAAPGTRCTAVFAPTAVRVRPVLDGAAALPVGTGSAWLGTVSVMEPIPGGIRLFTEEQPRIAVDCASMAVVNLGLHPGLQLSFTVSEDDISVRPSL